LRPPATAARPTEQAESAKFIAAIAKIGSPIALATALLFYFGWSRADSQARALGYDVTLLGLTSSDYVLRSINILFLPVILVLLLALVGYLVDPAVQRFIGQAPLARSKAAVVGILRFAWIWCPAVGAAGFVLLPSTQAMVIPFTLTIGILLSLYGDRLHRRSHQLDRLPSPVLTVILILLSVLLFWDVQRIADYMGAQFATYIKATPQRFASVTLYSLKSLEMPPEVTETKVGDEQSAYRFRYEGMRLLLRSDNKYFLLVYGERRNSPIVVVLPESDDLRAEFRQR